MPADLTNSSLPFAGLRCPKCKYDLSGLATQQCPECGEAFTPELIRRAERNARRRKWLIAALVMFVVMYAPYCWLLMDYPWGDYRWSWIKMWPGLPVLMPLHAMGRSIGFPDFNEITGKIMLDVSGVALWLLLAWIGSRGRRRLIIIAAMVMLLSLLNSWGLYHAFLM